MSGGDKSVGELLIEGLSEFVSTLKNDEPVCEKFTCRKVVLNLTPVPYAPEQVKATRNLLRVSQSLFAHFLGVSDKTVRSWEQGQSKPSVMACRFMDEIQSNPDYWRKRLAARIRSRNGSSGTQSCGS